ncbi:MAG: segregation/condensation protein A [Myxococcota bacterium]
MIEEMTPDSTAETGSGAGRACAVKLPAFEGPLDLLLHLIRTNEIDIAEIPIALISEQYLEYLEVMRQLDINVAADYLLMAATLAHIKSRMLLPPAPGDTGEEVADPRAELARRLAEYAVFKEVAAEFDRRPLLGRDVFTALTDVSGLEEPEPALHASVFALVEAMRRVLENLPVEQRHHQIDLERLTLRERMIAVMDRLQGALGDSLRFEDLLADGELTRHRVVVTFLAILELAKIQALKVFQNLSPQGQPFGPVRVQAAVGGAPNSEQIASAGAEAERVWELEHERALEDVSRGRRDAQLQAPQSGARSEGRRPERRAGGARPPGRRDPQD